MKNGEKANVRSKHKSLQRRRHVWRWIFITMCVLGCLLESQRSKADLNPYSFTTCPCQFYVIKQEGGHTDNGFVEFGNTNYCTAPKLYTTLTERKRYIGMNTTITNVVSSYGYKPGTMDYYTTGGSVSSTLDKTKVYYRDPAGYDDYTIDWNGTVTVNEGTFDEYAAYYDPCGYMPGSASYSGAWTNGTLTPSWTPMSYGQLPDIYGVELSIVSGTKREYRADYSNTINQWGDDPDITTETSNGTILWEQELTDEVSGTYGLAMEGMMNADWVWCGHGGVASYNVVNLGSGLFIGLGQIEGHYVFYGESNTVYTLTWDQVKYGNGICSSTNAQVESKSLSVVGQGYTTNVAFALVAPPTMSGERVYIDNVKLVEDDGTCLSCPAGESTPGSANQGISSVHFNLSLGKGAYGHNLGRVKLQSDKMTLVLATPASLKYDNFFTNEVDVVMDGSIMRQIKAPQALADIVVSNAFKYAIHFYSPDTVGGTSNGLYQVTGSPYVSWIVENPDASTNTYNRLKITEKRGSHSIESLWTWDSGSSTWSLAQPGRKKQLTTTYNGSGDRVETWTLRNDDDSIVSQEQCVFKRFDYGERLVRIVYDPDGLKRTNTFSYNNNGFLEQELQWNGFWRITQYNSDGLPFRVFTPFESVAPTTTASTCRMVEYSYAPLDGTDDDGTVNPFQPRMTKTMVLNQEVARSYAIYLPTETWEIQCQTPGAAWDADDSLTTISKRYTTGDFVTQTKSVRNPNGTMTFFNYAVDAATNKVTVQCTGAPSEAGTNIVDGTKTITVQGPLGNTLAITNIDIVSGIVTGWEVHTNFDGLLRPQHINYIEGRYQDITYACCGVESETDQDGNVTSYIYDDLKRKIATVRNGITMVSTLDAADNLLALTRIGTNNASILLSTNTFNRLAQLLSSTDAMTNITYYVFTNDASGQAVKTTTYPDGGTRLETNYLDGSLRTLAGTAVHGIRFESGVEVESGVYRTYLKDLKLATNGADSSEYIKTYSDAAGHAYLVKYPDSAAQRSYFNSIGQRWKSVDPDGVTTLFQYNTKGEVEYTAIDMDQNDTIDFAGTDRITRTVRSVGSATALSGNALITQIYAWNLNDTDSALLTSRSEELVDGSASANISLGLTNRIFHVFGTSGYTTNIAPDGSYSITLKQNEHVVSSARYDAGGTQLGQSTYTFDAHGRQTKASAANHLGGITDTVMTYDNLDRLVSVTVADGTAVAQTTTSYYDSMGRPWRTVQPDGTSVTNEFFATGKLKKAYGSGTYPVEYTYDYAGRMKTMKTWQNFAANSGAAVTTWNYHSQRGWLTSKQYADGKGPSYTYTAGGRLATRTWARGIVTTYSYDNAGQLSETDYDDGVTPNITVTYDRRGRPVTTSQTLGEDTSTMNSTFNDAGQLLKESWSAGPLNGLSVTNAYDSLQRRTDLWTINGSSVLTHTAYTYDSASRLATVGDGTNSATYGYLANSSLVGNILFKQSTTTRMTLTNEFDILNRQLAMDYWTNTAKVAAFHYGYNAANQRTVVTNVDASLWLYDYDTLGQLTSGKHYWSDGTPVAGQQHEYVFDNVGNRTSSSSGGDAFGGNLRKEEYAQNALNQYDYRTVPGYADVQGAASSSATVTVNHQRAYRRGEYFRREVPVANITGAVWQSITNLAVLNNGTNADIIATNTGSLLVKQTPELFRYDADGNLTADGQFNYTWDSENRLTILESDVSMPSDKKLREQWEYSSKGAWAQKVVSEWNGGGFTPQYTNKFAWDRKQLIAVLDNGNRMERALIRGVRTGGGLATLMETSAGVDVCFQATDAIGNICKLISCQNGQETASYEYGPFGNTIRGANQGERYYFGFNGQLADSKTEIVKYLFRDYLASVGRWLTRDPSGEESGKNLYAFVDNSPIGRWDPFGLSWADLQIFTDEWSISHGHNLDPTDPDLNHLYEIARVVTAIEFGGCAKSKTGCCTGNTEPTLTVTVLRPRRTLTNATLYTGGFRLINSDTGSESPFHIGGNIQSGFAGAFVAGVRLHKLKCKGDSFSGSAIITSQAPNRPVNMTFDYNLTVNRCGIYSAHMSVTPNMVAGDVGPDGNPIIRPAIHVGSNHEYGPWQPPYPPFQ